MIPFLYQFSPFLLIHQFSACHRLAFISLLPIPIYPPIFRLPSPGFHIPSPYSPFPTKVFIELAVELPTQVSINTPELQEFTRARALLIQYDITPDIGLARLAALHWP